MMRKVWSILGLAGLSVVGAPATGYSDSLPGLAARARGSEQSCVNYSPGSGSVTNVCGGLLWLSVPVQSRAAGTWTFYATAPQPSQTQCSVYLRDFNDNYQYASGYYWLNGRTQLGRTTVYSNTVINYACLLQPNGSLNSADWTQ